jgi:hypothetical protein
MPSTPLIRGVSPIVVGLLLLAAADDRALGQEAVPAAESGARSGDCSTWRLNGYRLGMPFEEAGALREMKAGKSKPDSGQATFTVKEPGRIAGTLVFDSEGRLLEWSTVYLGADPDRIRSALIHRLGVPLLDDRVGAAKRTRFGDDYRRLVTAWRNEVCDAGVVLAVNTAVENEEVTSVRVSLLRADEVERETADAAGALETSEEAEAYLD